MKPITAIYIAAAAMTVITSCRGGDDTVVYPSEGDDVVFPKPQQVTVTVIDYSPAPGQFVNELPEWETGDTEADMRRKASESINSSSLVTLGAFGGSITMELSVPITNLLGEPDFQITGNAIPTSSEPGIVEVSPDGTIWYALRGEKWNETTPSFTVTYHLPEPDASDAEYIRWTATDGNSGWISRNSVFHTQPFFPQWKTAAPVTVTARRLPDNGKVIQETGQYHLTPLLGYADSYPNNTPESYLNIESAVNAEGESVYLKQISFIRVTTGVLQNNGPLGECSTEISAVYRLHK